MSETRQRGFTKSSFTGVFTLRTQKEADELALAVKTLVERAVKIFDEVDHQGTSGEIEATLKTVIRLARSFQELTLDEAEHAQCKKIIDDMNVAEQGIYAMIQDREIGSQTRLERHKRIAAHMHAFLSGLGDLGDMMEANQNKRGLLLVKQAIIQLQHLRNPEYNDFEAKLKQLQTSLELVVGYIRNRENVVDPFSSLKLRLASLHGKISECIVSVAQASRDQNARNTAETEMKEKKEIAKLVDCLKEIADIFTVKEATFKSSFNFSFSQMENALDSLSEAVHNGSRAEVAAKARTIVDAVKQQNEADPKKAEAFKRASVQLVSAAKQALDSPSEKNVVELDSMVATLKSHMLELATAPKLQRTNSIASSLRTELLKASANLSNCLSSLAATEIPSPRS